MSGSNCRAEGWCAREGSPSSFTGCGPVPAPRDHRGASRRHRRPSPTGSGPPPESRNRFTLPTRPALPGYRSSQWDRASGRLAAGGASGRDLPSVFHLPLLTHQCYTHAIELRSESVRVKTNTVRLWEVPVVVLSRPVGPFNRIVRLKGRETYVVTGILRAGRNPFRAARSAHDTPLGHFSAPPDEHGSQRRTATRANPIRWRAGRNRIWSS